MGLAYSDLSARGLELPVVALTIDYRQALLHGDWVEIRSWVEPRRGVRLPWRSELRDGEGQRVAQARVELVLVTMGGGPERRRLQRSLPADLSEAVAALVSGPAD